MDDLDTRSMSEDELKFKIQSYQFAVTDISLFLDTHPTDKRALELHTQYVRTLKELQDMYEKRFGPLSIESIQDKWKWTDEPWPWERRNY